MNAVLDVANDVFRYLRDAYKDDDLLAELLAVLKAFQQPLSQSLTLLQQHHKQVHR